MSTASIKQRAKTRPGELDRVMSRLSVVSDDLRQSFESLAARAQHVEQELSRANAKLESKVTLVGVLDFIEVWNTELCEQDIERTLAARIEMPSPSLVDEGGEA